MVDSCRLYRSLYDIVHPSISRRNISNYEIVLKEDLIPVRIFYPRKDAKLEKVIIYIHGNQVNFKVYEEMAEKTECIVIYLDYQKNRMKEDCNHMMDYLVEELEKCPISLEKVLVMGDNIDIKEIKNLQIHENVKKIFLTKEVGVLKNSCNTIFITEGSSFIEKENIYQVNEKLEDFILNNNLTLNEQVYRIINSVVG